MKKLATLFFVIVSLSLYGQIETVADTIRTGEDYVIVKYTMVQDTLYFDEQMLEVEDQIRELRREVRRIEREEATLVERLRTIRRQKRRAIRDLGL